MCPNDNLVIKHDTTTLYNEFDRSLQNEIREHRLKSVDRRELTKQDRHVTNRKIKASLGISTISMNKILQYLLVVKSIFGPLSKEEYCRLPQILRNDDQSAQRLHITSTWMKNHGFI